VLILVLVGNQQVGFGLNMLVDELQRFISKRDKQAVIPTLVSTLDYYHIFRIEVEDGIPQCGLRLGMVRASFWPSCQDYSSYSEGE
jgi:hypothetical protein